MISPKGWELLRGAVIAYRKALQDAPRSVSLSPLADAASELADTVMRVCVFTALDLDPTHECAPGCLHTGPTVA